MRELYYVKRLVGGAVWFGLSAVLFAQASFGQGFISQEYRPRWFQEYENFAGYDLRKSPTYYTERYASMRDSSLTSTYAQYMGVMNRATYDQFGNFLLPGGEVYSMNWNQSRAGASNTYSSVYQSVFNRLVVSADEFSNWQTQFMIGRAYVSGGDVLGGLRMYVTPSTMKMTNFSGVRWDLSSRKNNVSLFLKTPMGTTASTPQDSTLYGLHWQSILGDVLKVGGTFVTHYRSTSQYSNIDIDENIKNEPRYVYLVLTDDSPEDTNNGPRIYDVKVLVNGEEQTVPTRAFKIPDIINARRFDSATSMSSTYYVFSSSVGAYSATYSLPYREESNLATSGSWFLNLINNNETTFAYLFSKRTGSGYGLVNVLNSDGSRYYGVDASSGYLEAAGTDVVIYEFQIPSGTRDLKFKTLVANDYNIDLIATFYASTMTSNEAEWDTTPFTTAWTNCWNVKYDAKNAAKAKGNVKDLSNTKWVTVQYDRVTGMAVYGLNMELNWRGLRVNGEVNEYTAYSAYPLNYQYSGGSHSTSSARAWFVTMEKDFDKWGFGGEAYNYPYDYMRYFGTVDDNDDNDDRTGPNESSANVEYPGLDVDWDRNYDTSEDGKPFLEYYYDGVVFGDDFNHNGTIDVRENDYAADYPYETNSYGHHFFVKLKPRERSLITAGYYDLQQETKEGRNKTEYLKFEHFQGLGSLGEMSIQHRTELIQYNSFNSYRFGDTGVYRYTSLMDSMVNTTLIHTRIKPIRNLNIINDVLTKLKTGYGDPITSADNTINEHLVTQIPEKGNGRLLSATFIHKADYTLIVGDREIIPDVYVGGIRLIKAKRIKELKLQPMIKFENAYSSVYNVRLARYYQHEAYAVYPILRVDYQVAPKTKLRCGFQGFPGWEEIHRVRNVDTYTEYALTEYNRHRMVLAFENRALYQGFNLVSLIGMRKVSTDYVAPSKQDTGITQYFFTIQSESSR